jgi:hypothetical protein
MRFIGLVAASLSALVAVGAQDAANAQETVAEEAMAEGAVPMPRPVSMLSEDEAAEDGLLSAEALDELVAPVALYPDALLTQVMVGSTYPLDIVKADRWVTASLELPDTERAAAAELEPWDASVQVLAAGFPTIVNKMATEIEWTEQLGDALIVQTDDVLDAIQRMRARAQATGFLESNEAQTVEVANDNISIAPANPEVVYVPTYDPQVVYYSQPTGAPVIYEDNWDDALMAGVIGFGFGMLVDDIFDDDDDWDDYWDHNHHHNHIDWDDGDIYARPDRGDINIDGDVNIGTGDRIDIDRDQIGNIDRDRIGNIDRDRVTTLPGRDDGAWRPTDDQRGQARDKVAAREGGGRAQTLPAGGDRAQARDRIEARGGGAAAGSLERPFAGGVQAPPRAQTRDTALSAGQGGARDANRASNRGASSHQHVNMRQEAQRPAQIRQPSSRPAQARAPSRKPSAHNSSFQRQSGGAGRAQASSNRGRQSGGGRGGGGRR